MSSQIKIEVADVKRIRESEGLSMQESIRKAQRQYVRGCIESAHNDIEFEGSIPQKDILDIVSMVLDLISEDRHD